MSRYLGRVLGQSPGGAGFTHDQPPRAGVLITNLGTPDAPERGDLRRYLKEFLSDPRVVEFPRVLWWLILNFVILNVRPARSAEAYRKIWTDQGSPLLVYTRSLVEAVSRQAAERWSGAPIVEVAMRYGEPSIPAALRRLHEAGVYRLLVLPMYPQYSGSTTGSTFDAVAQELTGWRWVPELRFANGYHDAPLYIDALAERIQRAWADRVDGPAREKLDLAFSSHAQYGLDVMLVLHLGLGARMQYGFVHREPHAVSGQQQPPAHPGVRLYFAFGAAQGVESANDQRVTPSSVVRS